MCNFYSITTNQAAIIALFRVVNRYVGNLAPMPGVFPDYPAPVIRNTDTGTEMTISSTMSDFVGFIKRAVPGPTRAINYTFLKLRNQLCRVTLNNKVKLNLALIGFVHS